MSPVKTVFKATFEDGQIVNVVAVDLSEAIKKASGAPSVSGVATKLVKVETICVIDIE